VGGRSRSHLRSRALRPRWRQGWVPRRRFRVPGIPGLPGLQGSSGPVGPPVQATAPEPLEPSGPSGPRASRVTDGAPAKRGPVNPDAGARCRGVGGRLWPRNGCRGVGARAMLRRTSRTPAWPNAVVVLVPAESGQDVWILRPAFEVKWSGSRPCNRVAIRRSRLTCKGVRPRGTRARRAEIPGPPSAAPDGHKN
jgi:hypothetical protein